MRYGIKAALSDAHQMAALDVDFLEVHLRQNDLSRHLGSLVDTFKGITRDRGLGMVVHAPEFVPSPRGAILVDISSHDEAVRQMSVAVLESTIAFSSEIDAVLCVVHPGGILPSATDPRAEGGIDRLKTSLGPIRDRARECNVLLTVENMPWFYHMKHGEDGGSSRWESTILVRPDDFGELSPLVDGITLDVSHGYLHSPKGGMEVIDGFIEDYKERVMHLHISDALPPDHEGLQIGEGSVDMSAVLGSFKEEDVSMVPEILGGHMADGLGFRRALEELRRIAGGDDGD